MPDETQRERYDGLACYTTDPDLAPAAGYYALDGDGQTLRQPPLRLVMVDDNPGNPADGSCHLEVALDGDPAQITRDGDEVFSIARVLFEAHAAGRAEVTAA